MPPVILFQKMILSNQCLAHSILSINDSSYYYYFTTNLITFKAFISFICIRKVLFISYSAGLLENEKIKKMFPLIQGS